jgi:2'-5' RNA ligase
MDEMITRCIHIFPKFANENAIENIRREYDDLYGCISPHITLVFPFKSTLTKDEIYLDINKILNGIKPFYLKAREIRGVESHGYYLFLNIYEGKDEIYKLHYKLHEGILKPYQSEWTKDGSFEPHITVGRFDDLLSFEKAVKEMNGFKEEFETIVKGVHIEIVGENDESIIESEIVFREND